MLKKLDLCVFFHKMFEGWNEQMLLEKLCILNIKKYNITVSFLSSDDYIYAVGGFNSRRLRSVERYDPVTDTWRYIESMNKERSHFKCVVHLNKIYAMGGELKMLNTNYLFLIYIFLCYVVISTVIQVFFSELNVYCIFFGLLWNYWNCNGMFWTS